MVYAKFENYRIDYKGKLTQDSFDSLILEASREIDKNINTRLTQGKINNLPKEAQEQLQYTACALVDLIYKKQERKREDKEVIQNRDDRERNSGVKDKEKEKDKEERTRSGGGRTRGDR